MIVRGDLVTIRDSVLAPSSEASFERLYKTEKFESAEILRRQVAALTHIRDVSLIKAEHRIDTGGAIRIEAYDVAHTAGT